MNDLSRKFFNNFEAVQAKIAHAAVSTGRDPREITLIVVSKAQPVDVLRAAIDAGINRFGENYPEETVTKKLTLQKTDYLEWHMIGHVQSRKAKLIANNFQRIHSIDSFSIAQKLNDLLSAANLFLPALLEFNIAGEESKSGWDASNKSNWNRQADEIAPILQLSHLQVDGIMVMPPLSNDEKITRNNFQNARLLLDFLADKFGKTVFQHLSMGTSADYEIAVQEGATFVRVGSAILGERKRLK